MGNYDHENHVSSVGISRYQVQLYITQVHDLSGL